MAFHMFRTKTLDRIKADSESGSTTHLKRSLGAVDLMSLGILRSAMERKESRLGCLREDYRDLDNIDWLRYVLLKQETGQMKVWTEPVPVEEYRLRPKREKLRHPFWRKVEELGYLTALEK